MGIRYAGSGEPLWMIEESWKPRACGDDSCEGDSCFPCSLLRMGEGDKGIGEMEGDGLGEGEALEGGRGVGVPGR